MNEGCEVLLARDGGTKNNKIVLFQKWGRVRVLETGTNRDQDLTRGVPESYRTSSRKTGSSL